MDEVEEDMLNQRNEIMKLEPKIMLKKLNIPSKRPSQHESVVPKKLRKIEDEKQYDPNAFCDKILEGLESTGDDLEAVSKFLNTSGSKLDYRRYGVHLIGESNFFIDLNFTTR